MILDRLSAELDSVAARYRTLWRCQAQAGALLVGALAAFFSRSLGWRGIAHSPIYTALITGLTAVLVVMAVYRWRRPTIRETWLARRIEARYPNLDHALLTAVELAPALSDGRYGFLQASVIQQALDHAHEHAWSEAIPRARFHLVQLSNVAGLVLLAVTVLYAPRHYSAVPSAIAHRASAKVPKTGEFLLTVEPGDSEIESGSSLLVLARIQGPMPADATLVSRSGTSEPVRQTMSASLDDPLFGGRLLAVTAPLEYFVESGDYVSPTYKVTVFQFPRLERADAHLSYPGYTGLEDRVVQDMRSVTVVEGTTVTLKCRLNKRVHSATLLEQDEQSQPLPPVVLTLADETAASSDAPATAETSTITETPEQAVAGGAVPAAVPSLSITYQATWTATRTQKFLLELVDDQGRRNPEPIPLTVQVVPNQPPTLKLVRPGRDLEVSPLEELDLQATAWDDFGLQRVGVTYGMAGQPSVDLVLSEQIGARQKQPANTLLRLEELQAEPDQLLAYYFWAEDLGSDGQVRRTSTDMYFAEVRHFDEIFRQGQQPPGGQQQQRQQSQQGMSANEQSAQQLAQLQKDIINATWTLIRRETGSQPTDAFDDDVKQVADSQATALEQAQSLQDTIQDSQSQLHLLSVLESMQTARLELEKALKTASPPALSPALAAEQAAYQALLKLRAREHQVVRQQRQQSGGGSQAGRSDQQRQQMEQLDLQENENRYETESLAQSQTENPEQRETRQVLNRLKELARRQHDLNERLKDLQSALQEAQTEAKKEEIRQQLKRLQDEQRDVLRDTDELQNRMETPENQERMADERQQLQEARDQVQRASEALEQDQVTRAAAAGTRAESQFDDLRNEFRRRTSGQFNDQIRTMRDAARELDQKEQELARQLSSTPADDGGPQSLETPTPGPELADELQQQRSRLAALNDRLKQTVEEAEQTEPLLAEKLNDAARNVLDQKVDRALQAAEFSVRRGLLEDARQLEPIAGRGLTQLRESLERAAESVLGDETEALRRARETLTQLNNELRDEIGRHAPEQLGTEPRASTIPGEAVADQRGANSPDQRNPAQGDQSSEQAGTPAEQADGDNPPSNSSNPTDRESRDRNQAGRDDPMSEPDAALQPGSRTSPADKPSDDKPSDERNAQTGDRTESPSGANQPGPNSAENDQATNDQSEAGRSGANQSGDGEPGDGEPGESEPGGGGPGNRESGAGQSNENQAGRSPDGSREGRQTDGRQTGGQQTEGQPGGMRGQPAGGPGGRDPSRDGDRNGGQSSGFDAGRRGQSPISGQDFLDWSDRLRDVEEMVEDPELRAEAARIRDAARAIRAEMKRHSAEPNWKLVRVNVAEPLAELANRVADELLRKNSRQALVPLDRDPVPPQYSEKSRRYYERLGSGR